MRLLAIMIQETLDTLGTLYYYQQLYMRPSLVAQTVQNPPEIQETQVQFLGWEDPLEKGRGHEEYGGLRVTESDMNEQLTQLPHIHEATKAQTTEKM